MLNNIFKTLNLNHKTEIIKLIILDAILLVIGVVAAILLRQLFIIALLAATIFIVDVLYFYRYKVLLRIQKNNLYDEFVYMISFLKIYLKNGYNVYTSLKEIQQFVSPKTSELLTKLIKDIDEDKTIKPFIKFSSNYEDTTIRQLLINLYQIIDNGADSKYFNQFDLVFTKLNDERYKKIVEDKDRNLGMLSIYPLIGSGLLIVMITIGVISILGSSMNVL